MEKPRVLAYADDALLLGAARSVYHLLDFLEERLVHFGWTLVWEKSIAWIPRLDLLDEIPVSCGAERKLLERVPRSRYGIKSLCLAADGDFSTHVGEHQISEPARKRAKQVERFCEELQKLLMARIAGSLHHAAWLLFTKSAACKLDYDARVCPQGGASGAHD